MFKQVIVMRTDLNMRKGKMVAQGAHASQVFLWARIAHNEPPSPLEQSWLAQGHPKVCVGAGSEAELEALYEKARAAGLTVHKIVDEGVTEFGGVHTLTCIAIGPNLNEAIDPITGALKCI